MISRVLRGTWFVAEGMDKVVVVAERMGEVGGKEDGAETPE
jgi:hypothetical protein